MDYKGVIDFNKYTLALATGGLIYTFEQLSKFKEGFSVFVLMSLLTLFAISLVLAIALFAAATKALHLTGDDAGKMDNPIKHLGTWHSVLLIIATIGLATTMFIHALIELKSESPEPSCCCISCSQ